MDMPNPKDMFVNFGSPDLPPIAIDGKKFGMAVMHEYDRSTERPDTRGKLHRFFDWLTG